MQHTTDWRALLEEHAVFWKHAGGDHPHAFLTSGKHSDGYCNSAQFVSKPELVAEVAAGIIARVQPLLTAKPDYVVGPAMGAVTIGHEVARQMGTRFAFTEPVHTEEGKMQVLSRFTIPKGATALIVEDAITTGGSAQKTIDELLKHGVDVLPFVCVIIDWSENAAFKDYKIVSLISSKMNVWEAEECLLCKQGSKAVRPKANWSELTT
jgi:orotate phosphoribosyltransferase